MRTVVPPSLSISLRGRVRLIRPFVEDNVMKTKHTYVCQQHSGVAKTLDVELEWPGETGAEMVGACIEKLGADRVAYFLRQQFAQHCFQGRLKSAWKAEKPSDKQTTLKAESLAGKTFNALDFVPTERGHGTRKPDNTVLAMIAAWEVLSADETKLGKLADRFNIEEMPSNIEELVAGYWAFVDAEKARVAKEASALLDL